MLVLILDSRTAINAASEGVTLCVQTLIPSLFPFFVFSSLLTGSLSGIDSRLLSYWEMLLRLPAGGGKLLVIGFLGGYPTGAACIRQAYDRNELSRQAALRLLSFCNNAGPSFLFGIITSFFPEVRYVWLLWMIHILSALTVSLLLPAAQDSAVPKSESETITLTQALNRSTRTMAAVCGWVVMFRMVLSFLDRWIFWFFPLWLQVILKGILELTNGCLLLGQIPDIPLRFVIASVLTGFGGLCVLLQTKSAIGDLPLLPYIRGKLLQAAFSFLYSFNALCLLPGQAFRFSPIVLLGIDTAVITMLLMVKGKKIVVAFRRNMVYNRGNVQK